jgi:hypothetical protein
MTSISSGQNDKKMKKMLLFTISTEMLPGGEMYTYNVKFHIQYVYKEFKMSLLKDFVKDNRDLGVLLLFLTSLIIVLLLHWKFPIPVHINMIDQDKVSISISANNTNINLTEKQRRELIDLINDMELHKTPYASMIISTHSIEIEIDGEGLTSKQRPTYFYILRDRPSESFAQIEDGYYSIQALEKIQDFLIKTGVWETDSQIT